MPTAAVLLLILSAVPPAATIRLDRDGETAQFVLEGLPTSALKLLAEAAQKQGSWTPLFHVRVHRNGAQENGELPPVSGRYVLGDGQITFKPRYPLAPGVTYRSVFDAAAARLTGTAPVEVDFPIPQADSAPTSVTAVYPSGKLLPENMLKFYLHFSAPMEQGVAYRHVHLLDSSCNEIELPFLELAEELWDRSGTRLTLLFDPGRVKRGLVPNEEEGPPLLAGKSYRLLIDDEWRDDAGKGLSNAFKREFQAGPADHTSPDPARWHITPPSALSSERVIVEFGEALDHALVERLLTVADSSGRTVEGEAILADAESRWEFTPKQTWSPGEYRLRIGTVIEDMAGNSIARPFEVDLNRQRSTPRRDELIHIPFTVK